MTSEKWKTFGLLVLAVILPPAVFLYGQRWWAAFFATIITVAIFWPAAALWAIVAVARDLHATAAAKAGQESASPMHRW